MVNAENCQLKTLLRLASQIMIEKIGKGNLIVRRYHLEVSTKAFKGK